MRLLVTGGAGFIGSNLVKIALKEGHTIINLDKLTYAGNLDSLKAEMTNPRHIFIQGDISNFELLSHIFFTYSPDALLNLAAESHVDRSIDGPSDFIQSNIIGTFCLLNAARRYYETLSGAAKQGFRFLQVSTDEVFGSLGDVGAFSEASPHAPNSPYSASKASADHLVRAWQHTYKLPTLTTHCSNNYGPYQFPEKLIPHILIAALRGQMLTVYGDGQNVRDWLYVLDHCRALLTVLERGTPGETYAVGGGCERTNIEIVHFICDTLDASCSRQDGRSYREQIVFVKDRPGHDRRYAIKATKIRTELGWYPEKSFEEGMSHTINWYRENSCWVEKIFSGSYRLERLGNKEG